MKQSTYREWKGWLREAFFQVSAAERAYFSAELRTCGIEISQASRVLEIGFGNGNFAKYCSEFGCSYAGSELDPNLVQRARDFGITAFEAARSVPDALEGHSVDLIVAFDVFEHIPADELVEMLRDLRQVLGPGGHIVARFPNGDSPFSAPLYNGDMTHRTLIGIGKLDQLCHSAGLKLVRFHPQTIPIRGLGFAHAARKIPVVLARRLVSRLIGLIYFGGRIISDPNVVAVMIADPDIIRSSKPATPLKAGVAT